MDPAYRLSGEAEKAVYDWHENDPDDPGYRRFVAPLFEAVLPHLPAGAAGLDFGCGAGSALMALFREAGFEIAGYDPFYAPHPDRLTRRYDFVICSESAEHFYDPKATFETLFSLLKPGGLLGVMTRFHHRDRPLEGWFYANDPTHVAFYSPRTFEAIAQQRDLKLLWCQDPIALFCRQ
jgi:SAM-dependent methyltransferase